MADDSGSDDDDDDDVGTPEKENELAAPAVSKSTSSSAATTTTTPQKKDSKTPTADFAPSQTFAAVIKDDDEVVDEKEVDEGKLQLHYIIPETFCVLSSYA